MKKKTAVLRVQKWGNSLAVRIPSAIALRCYFQMGTPVVLAVEKEGLTVKSIGEPDLSLDEMLKRFDPEQHGGEVMACGRIGVEKF